MAVPYISSAGGGGIVLATILPDGRVRYDRQLSGASPIPAGSWFYLDNFEWHLTYAA